MAKSFKKATTDNTRPKPTSERDFFDFLEEPAIRPAGSEPVTPLLGTAEPVPNGNISKPVLPGITPVAQELASFSENLTPDAELSRGVVAKPVASSPRRRAVTERPTQPISEPDGLAASPVVPLPAATTASVLGLPAVENSQGVRQTFVMGAQYLELLRDFVHAQRTAGAYWYTQRQAMEEALTLLFATCGPVAQRPDHIQVREQERRVRIQQGRRADQPPKDSPSLP